MFRKVIERGNNEYIEVALKYNRDEYLADGRGYYLETTLARKSVIAGLVELDYFAPESTTTLLKAVTRKSKKAEAEAEAMAIKKYNELLSKYEQKSV